MPDVDDYLAGLDEAVREAFRRVVDLALVVAPEAEQGTSYGMAALTLAGRPLLGLQAARSHLSIYPFSPAAVDVARDRLPARDVSKGTIRFTVESPLPADVVRDVVHHRRCEIDG